MPKRTNDFQLLVRFIEGVLADRRCKITESKEYIDKVTGEKREVDVVIEVDYGLRKVVTGIECVCWGRRADTPWVEKIYGKHQHIAVDKTVLVSKSGFTKPALEKARHYKFETLTLAETSDLDWASTILASTVTIELIHPLEFLGINIQVPSSLTVDEPQYIPTKGVQMRRCADDSALGTINDLVNRAIRDPEVDRVTGIEAVMHPGQPFIVPCGTLQPSYLPLPDGTKLHIGEILMLFRRKVESVDVKLIPASYSSATIAHGTCTIAGQTVMVSLVKESENGQVRIVFGGYNVTTVLNPDTLTVTIQSPDGSTSIQGPDSITVTR